MNQERQLDAFFFTLEVPCEERLSRLVEEYNALADRWSEEHEALVQSEREKREGRRLYPVDFLILAGLIVVFARAWVDAETFWFALSGALIVWYLLIAANEVRRP